MEKIILFFINLFKNFSWREIWFFIINPASSDIYLYLKFIFIALSFLILTIIIWLFMVTNWAEYSSLKDIKIVTGYKSPGAKKASKRWTKIVKKLASNKEADYKLAVIEADIFLKNTFKKIGYVGKTMREQLKEMSPAALPNIEEVREAHKIRNNIVHNPDYKLSLEKAREAVEAFKKALKDLEAL